MDRLAALKLFTKVVETGSFSEAGRQAGLAPSSVSRQISELETWVGATLFHRTTRQLKMTDAGQRFYERVPDILLDLEEARVISAQLEDHPTGLLRLSVPDSVERHMTVAMCAFQARWPSVHFSFDFTDRVVDLVAEGLDLALRMGRLEDSTLRARKITEVRRCLCASPRYLKKVGWPERPEDLADHNCLIFRASPGYNVWRFASGKEVIDVRASGSFSANSGRALTAAACDGLGLVLAPEWLLGPAMAQKELVEILPEYAPVPQRTPLYAVHPYQRFVPPRVRTFVDFLVDHFDRDYDWTTAPQ
jgi:DNA-binding transcriptional LysR family regulator